MNIKKVGYLLILIATSTVVSAQHPLSSYGPEAQVVQINLGQQYLKVYEGGSLKFESHISSGRPWMPTPTGVTKIGTTQDPVKVPRRPSHQFGGEMDHCVPLGFTDLEGGSKGIFAHEGTLYDPGTPAAYPASHGCIRLPKGKAKEFYDIVRTDAVVDIFGNSMDYFQKNFVGAELLRFSEDNKKLLGWNWNPKNGPDENFVKMATMLQEGKLKGAICPYRKDGTFSGKLSDLVVGFEFFGGPKDKVNVWDLGIRATLYNSTVDQYNAKNPSKRLKQIKSFVSRN